QEIPPPPSAHSPKTGGQYFSNLVASNYTYHSDICFAKIRNNMQRCKKCADFLDVFCCIFTHKESYC
ncbi:MAG: hypothetical protein UH103_03180, partial [Paludibacteraceae bacterium]|nr:hypothetical protein [Paludibacteraceae bacterium]